MTAEGALYFLYGAGIVVFTVMIAMFGVIGLCTFFAFVLGAVFERKSLGPIRRATGR
jgi:hypothetical protein